MHSLGEPRLHEHSLWLRPCRWLASITVDVKPMSVGEIQCTDLVSYLVLVIIPTMYDQVVTNDSRHMMSSLHRKSCTLPCIPLLSDSVKTSSITIVESRHTVLYKTLVTTKHYDFVGTCDHIACMTISLTGTVVKMVSHSLYFVPFVSWRVKHWYIV